MKILNRSELVLVNGGLDAAEVGVLVGAMVIAGGILWLETSNMEFRFLEKIGARRGKNPVFRRPDVILQSPYGGTKRVTTWVAACILSFTALGLAVVDGPIRRCLGE